jgi:hypothetical protein
MLRFNDTDAIILIIAYSTTNHTPIIPLSINYVTFGSPLPSSSIQPCFVRPLKRKSSVISYQLKLPHHSLRQYRPRSHHPSFSTSSSLHHSTFDHLAYYKPVERPMKVELALDPAAMVSLASRVAAAPVRGAAPARRGRGAGRPRQPRPAKKTAEELDAEMSVSQIVLPYERSLTTSIVGLQDRFCDVKRGCWRWIRMRPYLEKRRGPLSGRCDRYDVHVFQMRYYCVMLLDTPFTV